MLWYLPDMMNDPHKKSEHLTMIQAIVTRMAGNSTQMKTWTVSLVTAIFAFSGLSNDPHWLVAVGGCIPVIAFWFMDARYLHLEKCYRALHEAIVAGKEIVPFDLDYRPYAKSVDSVWKIAWSWSVRYFYGSLLILVVALLIILAK